MAWFRRKQTTPIEVEQNKSKDLEVMLEDAGPCRRIMHVAVPPERIRDEYERVVSLFQREATLPGFRKGKAPLGLVEARFAREIAEEVRDTLMPVFYREALARKGIEPEAVIDVSEGVCGKTEGLSFRVTIDVPPEFSLPHYTKIPLRRQRVAVTEQQVNLTLERFRNELARYEDVSNQPVGQGDIVLVDYAGEIEGRPIAELVPDRQVLGTAKHFWLLVEEREFLPGFCQGLLGMRCGDTKEIQVQFPPSFPVTALAGKQGHYSVSVKAIRVKRIPDLQDPALLEAYGVKTVEELRETARKQLLAAAEDQERERLKGEIAKLLLAHTSFDLPEAVVERETRLTVRQLVRRIAWEGATSKQIEEQRNQILNAATRTSRDRVKLSYILRRIGRQEGLTVTEQEVEERLQHLSKRFDVSVEQLRNEMEKQDGLIRLRDEILCEKTMDWLLANAHIKE
ncbi:MAG: trigger factor [Kiritimatiellia bacterium]